MSSRSSLSSPSITPPSTPPLSRPPPSPHMGNLLADQMIPATQSQSLPKSPLLRVQRLVWSALSRGVTEFLAWDFALHALLMLTLVWIAGAFGVSGLLAVSWAAFYLFLVSRSQRAMIDEEAAHKAAVAQDQRKLLTDVESVAWLNGLLLGLWNVNIEPLVSTTLMHVAPWFLEMYRPAPLSVMSLEQITLGKSPPLLSNAKLYQRPNNGDHAVLEMDMEFLGDQHCAAKVNVRMTALGFWAHAFISKLSIRGKVRIGLRFLPDLPFLDRVRVSFVGPPVLRMAIHPLTKKNVDITNIPLVASYIQHTIAKAIECSLVEPNILTIDVHKLLDWDPVPCALRPDWLAMQRGQPAAKVHIEVIEARDLKIADIRGSSDPYVKLQLGRQKLKSSIKYKDLNPVWNEAFDMDVLSWRLQNILHIEVKDKDQWNRDDAIGYRAIDLSRLRDGQRRDMWLVLQGVATGKLHVAITVSETPLEQTEGLNDEAIGVEEAQKAAMEMEGSALAASRPPLEVAVELPVGKPGAMKVHGPGLHDSRSHAKYKPYDPAKLAPEGPYDESSPLYQTPGGGYSSTNANTAGSLTDSGISDWDTPSGPESGLSPSHDALGGPSKGGVRRRIKKGLSRLLAHGPHRGSQDSGSVRSETVSFGDFDEDKVEIPLAIQENRTSSFAFDQVPEGRDEPTPK